MQDKGCWEGVSHPLEEVIARVYKKVSVRFPESGSTFKAFPSDARIVESPPPPPLSSPSDCCLLIQGALRCM